LAIIASVFIYVYQKMWLRRFAAVHRPMAMGEEKRYVQSPLERTMAMIGAEIVMAGIGIVFAYITTLKLR